MALLWNAIKEAARVAKGQMSKNARNATKAEAKKERGPVKTFFHITKNENVPAIEQQGLLTNHPNANINSANHPFRKHGTDAGGVWVTTEPTAFPVYGTTIGGKNGNASARADALSTIKIDVPLPELPKMKAVQDPYGKNILRKGDDPRAIEDFGTWAGIDVPTTVLLNDVKPQWLKNVGYVEEAVKPIQQTFPELLQLKGGWAIDPKEFDNKVLRMLNKADLRASSGLTGHHSGNQQLNQYEKNPSRFVDDYINRNQPIIERLPEFPKPNHLEYAARYQGAVNGPKYIKDGMADVPAPNEANRYSVDFIPARKWTEDYRDYVKSGESIKNRRQFEFAPGAISRGIGGFVMPSIKERNFNWNKYKKLLEEGDTPRTATFAAQPSAKLDWDNIVYHSGQYRPRVESVHDFDAINEGAVSRGMQPVDGGKQADLRKAADEIRRWRNMTDNAQVVKDYGVSMTDDELRELDRLEARNTPEGIRHLPGAMLWSKLENPEILHTRQRALDKIKGSWLYDYLLNKK